MQFVYFLILPSALLSNHLVSYQGTELTSDVHSGLGVAGQALLALLLSAMNWLSGVWLSLTCIVLLGLFLVSLVSVCWWTEVDADRTALEIAVRSHEDLDRKRLLSEHGQYLCDALSKIYQSRNCKRASWMHPSCEHRIAAIRSVARRAS